MYMHIHQLRTIKSSSSGLVSMGYIYTLKLSYQNVHKKVGKKPITVIDMDYFDQFLILFYFFEKCPIIQHTF